MRSWLEQARFVISRAISEGVDAKEDIAAIRKRVDSAYPFGERQYHPYKMWLKARLQLFVIAGLATTEEAERAKKSSRPFKERCAADLEYEKAQKDGLFN